MCSLAVGWNILYMSVRFIWAKIQCNFNVFLLIFCVDDLPIVQSAVLKSLFIIVWLAIVPFRVQEGLK